LGGGGGYLTCFGGGGGYFTFCNPMTYSVHYLQVFYRSVPEKKVSLAIIVTTG
jgi:hypothetical protein